MPDTHSRLIAKLIRELLRTHAFDTDADLAEATKVRCARLCIPYTAAAVGHALDMVGSNRSLVVAPPIVRRRHPAPGQTGPPPLTRSEAASLVPQLWARYYAEHAVVDVP